MTDRLAAMTDAELGGALSELGTDLAYPEVEDLSPVVLRRIAKEPARRPVAVRFPIPRFPRARVARRVPLALAAVLALAGAAAAGGLLVRGVRILIAPETAPSPAAPAGQSLFLGDRVSLDEADRRVAFDVVVPEAPGLPPAVVYAGDDPPGGRVSLVYPAGPGLPRTRETGVGMLIVEFRGQIERPFIEKIAAAGDQVEEVTVAGAPGYWIEGPHTVSFLDRQGEPFAESTRVAGNTLLWQRGGLTLRLESALSMEDAIRIAASVR